MSFAKPDQKEALDQRVMLSGIGHENGPISLIFSYLRCTLQLELLVLTNNANETDCE